MIKKSLLAFSVGAAGGVTNVIFLSIAAVLGLPALFGLSLPDFSNPPFLYKQVFWGGLWSLTFLLPVWPRNWIIRGIAISVITAAATFFIFFPMGTSDGKGPGIAGLNIGLLMPVYVLLADLAYGLTASKLYELVTRKEK